MERALLGMAGFMAATIGATAGLFGKWIPRPQPTAPTGWFGLLQAFHHCPTCRSLQPHIVHSTADRTCQTCRTATHPGSTP